MQLHNLLSWCDLYCSDQDTALWRLKVLIGEEKEENI